MKEENGGSGMRSGGHGKKDEDASGEMIEVMEGKNER